MIYLTLPVTRERILIEFLLDQMNDSFSRIISSKIGDHEVEAHKDLIFASQQALNAFRRSEEPQQCHG
jgi:hypothetical protein